MQREYFQRKTDEMIGLMMGKENIEPAGQAVLILDAERTSRHCGLNFRPSIQICPLRMNCLHEEIMTNLVSHHKGKSDGLSASLSGRDYRIVEGGRQSLLTASICSYAVTACVPAARRGTCLYGSNRLLCLPWRKGSHHHIRHHWPCPVVADFFRRHDSSELT